MLSMPTSPAAGPSEAFREPAQIEKLQLLYRQSTHGALAAAVCAVLWAMIVQPHVERERLIAWSIGIGVTILARLVLFVAYFRRKPQGTAVLAWELPYKGTLLTAAAVWGIGCVLVMPHDSLLHQTITFFFLVGMAGAGIPAYSVLLRTMQALIVLMVGPMIAFLFGQGETNATLLAVAGVWFFLTVMRATAVHSIAVEQSILLSHELRAAKGVAERQALTDPLTGLNNRRAFTRSAEGLVRLGRREGRTTALLLLDVDHFKRINDTHGHASGDAVLQAVAELLLANTRRSDVCGRMGGDEFAILLPNTGLEDAMHVADKMRMSLAQHPTHGDNGAVRVTLSIGAISADEELESMLGLADKAMYVAKNAGRDRVARLA